jgi:hypothetical protein
MTAFGTTISLGRSLWTALLVLLVFKAACSDESTTTGRST